MAELTIENVSKRFGGLLAVENLDLTVPQGKILSLIGPNGAGKTTVFNMVTGVYPPTEGAIIFKGHKLNNLRSNRIIAHGIARTFQNIRLFKSMTVGPSGPCSKPAMKSRKKKASAKRRSRFWNLSG